MSRNSDTKRVYRISRGDKYSCLVTIINGDTLLITEAVFPPDSPETIINTLLEDAEREALKMYGEETGKWSSSSTML